MDGPDSASGLRVVTAPHGAALTWKEPEMAKKSSSKLKTSGPSKNRKASGSKTKKQLCIEMLKRPKGASLAELQKAIGWQSHSVRGFLSGTVKKMEGIKLNNKVTDDGERRYSIETGKAS